MITGKIITVTGAIILLTSLLGIGIGLYSRVEVGIYLLMPGIGILSFILGLYIQLKNYIRLINCPKHTTYKLSSLDTGGEITDNDIADEIERHMENHKH